MGTPAPSPYRALLSNAPAVNTRRLGCLHRRSELPERYHTPNTLRDVLKDTPGDTCRSATVRSCASRSAAPASAAASTCAAWRSCRTASPSIWPTAAATSTRSIRSPCARSRSYKGGNALTFGATTLGGAVNFVTRRTAYTAFAPNILRLDGGSFGTIRENFQVSRISGAVDVLINGTVTNSDGFRITRPSAPRTSTPTSATSWRGRGDPLLRRRLT